MAKGELGEVLGQKDMRVIEGTWRLEEDDFLLYAMLTDPIFCSELLFEDPNNFTHGGCYVVGDFQYPLFRPPAGYAAFPCARKVGKALPLDAPVLTPSGWTTMGKLQVGDLLVGSNGLPTRVIGAYPQGMRDIYAVRFKDGGVVECDDEHLWTVTCDHWESPSHRSNPKGPRTMTLKDIRGRKTKFRVASLSAPVAFEAVADPEWSPWLVGALIGDGNVTRETMIRFASIDAEIVDRVRREIGDDAELVHDDRCNYRVRSREYIVSGAGSRKPCELLAWSRRTGFHGKAAHQKRIPLEYLWGSVHTRCELLRGLVDTDGAIVHSGSVEICTASQGLAEDIRHLVLSLGGKVSVNRAEAWLNGTRHRDRFRVVFKTPGITPCYLGRKVTAYTKATAKRTKNFDGRIIESIALVGRRDAKCVEVAAPDGLFVVEDFILTHNTESAKAKAVSHAFKRQGEDLLVTAPELIHLHGLTEHIEQRISEVRLTREFLKRDSQKTGFTHKPFQVDFTDGTRIVGRIPHLTGKGVKGMHEPDLLMDESQDYPANGFTEVHETVQKDHVDSTGKLDFTYHLYGVHSGAAGGRFETLVESGEFNVVAVTAMMRPGWNKAEKAAAAAMYGGTHSPDYRRNILGEPGTALSQFFVTSRLMSCLDQDRESAYNTMEFKDVHLIAEDVDKMIGPGGEIGALLDLPTNLGPLIYGGMDIGLINDPTVITLFAVQKDKHKKERLKLCRMYHLWRFRERQIREVAYRLDLTYGKTLKAFGQDITGMGLPLLQGMEDDERCPDHLRQVIRGYTFNALVPVAVDENYVSEMGGKLVDQYGNHVKEERDKWTGQKRLVSYMTMIEASTRYLRNFVDTGFIWLPFHQGIVKDMQGETEQRVRAMGSPHLRKKPSAFHILDAMRAMGMAYMSDHVEENVLQPSHTAVLEQAVNVAPGVGGGMELGKR
jgi:hypothetical protein